ncbi:gamma carbonic anhydrase family protein [Aliarcobacter skirrowii]|uniref:gamma carbonic anhydrase family protein n=1 Tax=Aliarcobacter skirrowii TaxID=28200 RepID=UPI0008327758|nr:gamma carbonic anhydrase family protein [Aliarcobacter skirrowii]MDX4062551.1 gamma carbonic anhydrase family protein [Aliarcobacter skirrowii]
MVLNYKEFSPKIGKNVWIAPSADVIGQVTLEEDVSIWFGCVVRADVNVVKIGKNSNIQDLSCIHTDKDSQTIIGENVTVGHRAILHGCKIENNCLIGMGATILDNVVIGEGSIVGANSLVTYGKVFPPKSLIMGSPAKVVRELSDEEVKGLKEHALHYVDYKNDYM